MKTMIDKSLVPKRAIITTSSSDEAGSLLELLEECGYRWGASENCWYSYEANTCYSIEPNGEVLFGSRRWYEEHGPSDPCWPDDPKFQFISAEDFMAICRGLKPKLESEIEINPDALDLIL